MRACRHRAWDSVARQLTNTADQQTTNKPDNQQSNEPTDQQANKSMKNQPKCTKMHPRSIKNRSRLGSRKLLDGSWTALGWILASRAKICPKRSQSGNVLDPQVRFKIEQNPDKSFPRATQKVIIFLIGCVVGFWCHLVPTWVQLGRQNPPKIDPSWSQNPSKKGSRC